MNGKNVLRAFFRCVHVGVHMYAALHVFSFLCVCVSVCVCVWSNERMYQIFLPMKIFPP